MAGKKIKHRLLAKQIISEFILAHDCRRVLYSALTVSSTSKTEVKEPNNTVCTFVTFP